MTLPSPAHLSLLAPMFMEMPAPQAEGTRALYRLWCDSRRSGGDRDDGGGLDSLPHRDVFSFETLKRIGVLGHEFLIEPADGGRDWRYRLIGAEIVWMFGRDPTGVPFSKHFIPAEAEQCITLSNRVARTGRPLFLQARFVSGEHSAGILETMSLPILSRDGGEVWLIGASFPVAAG